MGAGGSSTALGVVLTRICGARCGSRQVWSEVRRLAAAPMDRRR